MKTLRYFRRAVTLLVVVFGLIAIVTFQNTITRGRKAIKEICTSSTSFHPTKLSASVKKQQSHKKHKIPFQEDDVNDDSAEGNDPESWLKRWTMKLGSDVSWRWVFYNRVGKCGSTTIMNITHTLEKERGYKVIVYVFGTNSFKGAKKMGLTAPVGPARYTAISENSVKIIHGHTRNYVHIHHTFFIDFKHKYQKIPLPIYVNVVRDPFSHFQSAYWHRMRHNPAIGMQNSTSYGESLEQCLTEGLPGCVLYGNTSDEGFNVSLTVSNRILMYFCGADKKCIHNISHAVTTSIRRLERDYLIVGHLERLYDYVLMLEFLLPEFYSGASSLIARQEGASEKLLHLNKGRYSALSSNAVDKAMQMLKPSYRLYRRTVKLFDERFSLVEKLKERGIRDRRQLFEELQHFSLDEILDRPPQSLDFWDQF